MFKINVLMTCHNRKDKTVKCLESLFLQEGLNKNFVLGVYLVDDGSSDGTSEIIKKYFPLVNIIQGTGDLFWNRGMYTAWKEAAKEKSDYYLWLNDDTILYNYAIDNLVQSALETNNKAIICGCTESAFNKGKLTYGGGIHKDESYISNYPDGKTRFCTIINGNCVLVPAGVFEIVGNLDWRFSHGIGDNDYSLRAKKMGVASYTSSLFVGTCELNSSIAKWSNPGVKLFKRLKILYSPLGNPPLEYFHFEKRHFGHITATKHLISTHLKVFFPRVFR